MTEMDLTRFGVFVNQRPLSAPDIAEYSRVAQDLGLVRSGSEARRN
jgi:hypothetical protein